jgi:hypothetical protein
MAKLPAKDRDAVALRYLEQRSLRDVGAALGTSEEAAKKRVARAVDKLRAGFMGHTSSSLSDSGIAVALGTYNMSAPTAPAWLANNIIRAVSAGRSAAAPGYAIADRTMNTMGWSGWKTAAVVGGTAVAILTAAISIFINTSSNGASRSSPAEPPARVAAR